MSTSARARDAWFMQTERQERELAAKAKAARGAELQASYAKRWRAATLWVADNLPDLVDGDGEVCPFAVHAAITVRGREQRTPHVEEVLTFRRNGWAHIREEEEGTV